MSHYAALAAIYFIAAVAYGTATVGAMSTAITIAAVIYVALVIQFVARRVKAGR